MRNRFGLCTAAALALTAGIACSSVTEMIPGMGPSNGSSNPASNPETMLREKTGVPECDELIDFFADESKFKDDNYVTRAAKEYFFNKIRQAIKESIEKNKNKPQEMAKECKDFKKQIDAQLAQDKNAKK